MSCNGLGLVGSIIDRATPAMVKGSDTFIVTQIVFKGSNDPYSFQSFAGSTAYFPAADGGVVTASGALVSADLGTVRFELGNTETDLLAEGSDLSFEQRFADDRGLSIIQYEAALSIAAALF